MESQGVVESEAVVQLRPGEAVDHDFVGDSWRRSFDGSETALCPGGLLEYIHTQRQVIEQALSTSSVLVAYPEGTPSQILGWCCYRRPLLIHYVYVKAPFRKQGIGRALVAEALGGGPPPTTVFTSHPWRHGDAAREFVNKVFAFPGTRVRINPALIFAGKT